MEVLNRRAPFFYNEMQRNADIQNKTKNTRISSIVNTYQNQPKFQIAENLSRNYARIGQQKYDDPFKFHMRPYYNEYDGRNLSILNTLKVNAEKDKPDIITKYPLKVVGYY